MDAQDARDIFQQAWNNVERHYGLENMRFPKELLFLMGAPGAGKGTLTPSIMQMRQIKNPPIGVSSLLTSPECQRLKNQGLLISDGYVFELLLHAVLLSPNADSGVLIDGFPRTEIQAQMLCFLQEKWQDLSRQFSTTSMHWRYPQANIRLCVLYVDEATSIERQLIRGRQIREHNKVVKQTGQGQMQEERATDFDEQLIRERYHIFRNNYDSLLQLRQTFPLHLIHAYGKIDQVFAKIEHQLQDHEHEKAARPSSELFNMNFALQYLDLHVLPHLLHQPYPNKQHVAPL
ncbi:hypothetical protein BC940DRAFT_315137 [Gongronella butleri]|nr:hypothetical protein BC940DRAFT_315137 [Gongronella butleri]